MVRFVEAERTRGAPPPPPRFPTGKSFADWASLRISRSRAEPYRCQVGNDGCKASDPKIGVPAGLQPLRGSTGWVGQGSSFGKANFIRQG